MGETRNWTKQGKYNWFATMEQETLWAKGGWALEWLKLYLLSSYYFPGTEQGLACKALTTSLRR